jgi:hypothetical protein
VGKPKQSGSPAVQLTPQWKAWAKARLEELRREGRTTGSIAEKFGIDQSAINHMIGPDQKVSEWAIPLSEELGIPPPALEVSDPLDWEAFQEWRKIAAASPRAAAAVLERLRRFATAAKAEQAAELARAEAEREEDEPSGNGPDDPT